MPKKKDEITIRSSAAEYLTYVVAVGDNAESMEMRYEDGELIQEATIKKFFIVQNEGNRKIFVH